MGHVVGHQPPATLTLVMLARADGGSQAPAIVLVVQLPTPSPSGKVSLTLPQAAPPGSLANKACA